MPKKIIARGPDKVREHVSDEMSSHGPDLGMAVDNNRLLAALINELARSRVRHRALLDVLEQSGTIELKSYVRQYREVEEKDFKPFVELLLLSSKEFEARHGAWLAESARRFAYDGSSRVHLRVSERVEKSVKKTAGSPRSAKATK